MFLRLLLLTFKVTEIVLQLGNFGFIKNVICSGINIDIKQSVDVFEKTEFQCTRNECKTSNEIDKMSFILFFKGKSIYKKIVNIEESTQKEIDDQEIRRTSRFHEIVEILWAQEGKTELFQIFTNDEVGSNKSMQRRSGSESESENDSELPQAYKADVKPIIYKEAFFFNIKQNDSSLVENKCNLIYQVYYFTYLSSDSTKNNEKITFNLSTPVSEPTAELIFNDYKCEFLKYVSGSNQYYIYFHQICACMNRRRMNKK